MELFDQDGRSRGFYSGRNRLNELTGKEWVYWSKSVINRPYPPSLQHRLRSRHGGQKPPELCADLIRLFTKSGGRVLDPFAGVGGTLLGAALCGRSALGIELNPEWVGIYRRVCALEGLAEQRLLCGDSRQMLGELAAEGLRFDLLLTDVPYWHMDKARRSTGAFKRVGRGAAPPASLQAAGLQRSGAAQQGGVAESACRPCSARPWACWSPAPTWRCSSATCTTTGASIS